MNAPANAADAKGLSSRRGYRVFRRMAHGMAVSAGPQDVLFGRPWALVVSGVLFVLLAFRQAGTVPGTFGMNWTRLLATICALLWIVTRLAGQRSNGATRVTTALVCVYVAISLLSFGEGLRIGWPRAANLATGDSYVMLDLMMLGWVGFMLTTLVSVGAVLLVVRAMVLGATVSALWALISVFAGIDLAAMIKLPFLRGGDSVLVRDLMRAGQTRPQGSAGHPLELAIVVTMAWPMAVALYYEAKSRGVRRWPWALCSVLLGAACLVALSRSALVGLVAAYIVLAWRFPVQRVAKQLVVGTIGFLLALAAQPDIFGKIIQVFAGSSKDPSIASRGRGIEAALPIVQSHPILGQGFASYTVYPQVLLDNGYLGRLVETGFLGLGAFVAILVWSLREIFRARTIFLAGQTSAEQGAAALCGGIAAALVALSLGTLFLDIGAFLQAWFSMWCLIALCGCLGALARAQLAQREAESEPPDPEPQTQRLGHLLPRSPRSS